MSAVYSRRGIGRVWRAHRGGMAGSEGWASTYDEEGPDGVVGEYDGGGHEHGEADEFVELGGMQTC